MLITIMLIIYLIIHFSCAQKQFLYPIFKRAMASKPVKLHLTRNIIKKCPIFGDPTEMNKRQLPTYNNVIKDYLHTRDLLTAQRNNKWQSVAEISELVSTKVEKIWQKASLPILSHTRIVQMIKSYHSKYASLIKNYKRKMNDPRYKGNIQDFVNSSHALFDVCTCKCQDISKCTCEKNRKVPKNEEKFLLDQRSERLLVIGRVDKAETKHLQKKIRRRLTRAQQEIPQPSTSAFNIHDQQGEDTGEVEEQDSSDEPWTMPSNMKPKRASQNQMRSLEQTSVTCDRFQVSDRAGAAIATSVLSDLGFVSSEDRSRIIDKGKLRRERQKQRTALQHKGDIQGIKGLYFDGRKDKTLVQEKDEKGFTQQKIILEEHITILAEPNSESKKDFPA